MHQVGPRLPFAVQGHRGQRFEITRIDERASQDLQAQAVEIFLCDYRGACIRMPIESALLLSIADTIYRACSREPRDQPLRVEVALAPPAAAAAADPAQAPRLRLVDEAGEDIEAIKRGLLR